MLKKVGFIGAFLLGLFTVPSLFAQCGSSACCQPSCEEPCGECYCKYVQYMPQCRYKQRCYQECYPCTKKCCQMVPEYYNVQRCRYVPEYYTIQVQKCRYRPEYYCEQKCRYVPQSYEVQEYKTCTKSFCEPEYYYVPRYFWKHECKQSCAPCASGRCGG